MGQFTRNLPDYSKNDVVMFIARQINSQQFNYVDLANAASGVVTPAVSIKEQLSTQLRAKYFECLHEICTKYRPTQLFSAFSSVPFLEDILRLTLVADWASRRKAHEIIHYLLDKYQIIVKIKQLKPGLFSPIPPVVVIKTAKSTVSLANAKVIDEQPRHGIKEKYFNYV